MEMGKVRNELTKELEIREDEFEQNKQSYLKRIRGLETQLDDEIHERQIINREKLELERKLKSLASSKNSGINLESLNRVGGNVHILAHNLSSMSVWES